MLFKIMDYMQDKFVDAYRKNVVGCDRKIYTRDGEKTLVYADWAASGRLYRPIEEKICDEVGPFYGNTHSIDSHIGRHINSVYEQARATILNACNAVEKYELIIGGSGATFALHRFQEIMSISTIDKVVVFISRYEHNTNYLTWISLRAEVVILDSDINGNMNLNFLEEQLKKYVVYDLIIGSFTACSNVTGIMTNYIEAAKIVKEYNGIGIVDYSTLAPHTVLDFSDGVIDAAYWGIHKFLGGPSGPGILLFKTELYKREIPTIPSGGTVLWADPAQRVVFFDEISKREDPGTPAILQTVRASLAHLLISEIGGDFIYLRELHFSKYLINALMNTESIHVFLANHLNRKPIVSFIIDGLSHNIVTQILSDFYGIQARSGCSCATIYAHELLNINDDYSNTIYQQMKSGNYKNKPG